MVVSVKGCVFLLMLAACDLPGTNVPPDAGTTVEFRLGLTSRYADPATALEGLRVWADGVEVPRQGEVRYQTFASMAQAQATTTELEVRYGDRILDRVFHSPGDTCIAERGDDNRLLLESVNLCVRANGELQLNDFSCDYLDSGYFTADVFCPTDCHPLLGVRSCGDDERCGLVLSSQRPRFGLLACVPIGEREAGESCSAAPVGEPDACGVGLACVEGECRPFCLSDGECRGGRCVSALRGVAEPTVCIDDGRAPAGGTAALPP